MYILDMLTVFSVALDFTSHAVTASQHSYFFIAESINSAYLITEFSCSPGEIYNFVHEHPAVPAAKHIL